MTKEQENHLIIDCQFLGLPKYQGDKNMHFSSSQICPNCIPQEKENTSKDKQQTE